MLSHVISINMDISGFVAPFVIDRAARLVGAGRKLDRFEFGFEEDMAC